MRKNNGEHSAVFVIVSDVILAAVFLLIFALFHHVLPAMGISLFPSAYADSEYEQEVVAPATEEKTPWQIKFADYFTDDIVTTENSYSSPNVSIKIDTLTYGERSAKSVYHVADIHIASIDCLKTYVSHGQYKYFDAEPVMDMDAAVNAILAIGGDFCTYQKTGFLVRNGEVLRNDKAWCDALVLYEDGSMECLLGGKYNNDDVLDNGALQVWNFGPSLLDENGEIRYNFTASQAVLYPNPRSAKGLWLFVRL